MKTHSGAEPVTPLRDESAMAIKHAMEFDGDPKKLKEYYGKWAQTYDNDVSKESYCAPRFIAEFLLSLSIFSDLEIDVKNPDLSILDAGCGTGLVGKALAEKGYRRIEGCDLSPDMTERARKTGVYRKLQGSIDLTRHNDAYRDAQYEVVICCGAFTGGHLPPKALEELVRLTKSQGLVIVSTRKSYYHDVNFEGVYTHLQRQRKIKLLRCVIEAPYLKEEGAHYFAFIVC